MGWADCLAGAFRRAREQQFHQHDEDRRPYLQSETARESLDSRRFISGRAAGNRSGERDFADRIAAAASDHRISFGASHGRPRRDLVASKYGTLHGFSRTSFLPPTHLYG